LQQIEQALLESGLKDFRIIVVGDGSEVAWLKQRLGHGEFLGVLHGEELARAYANMDVFVFPSRTDTFGNVVQEAAASGVAAVVTNEGGPRHLVVPAETGYIAEKDVEFVERVVELAHNRERLKKLGSAARERMMGITWDGAFEKTYAAYRHCLPAERQSDCLGKKAKAAAQTPAGLHR
jgi:phosphatidylinositol alpha 1,6-mannosyltransferase